MSCRQTNFFPTVWSPLIIFSPTASFPEIDIYFFCSLLHFSHVFDNFCSFLMGALTGLQAQLERMGARSESGHYRSLPPVPVSVRPFFLEPMKLAPFLTGSNTRREEVIATSCFDSLVCGKAKTEGKARRHRWRSRVTNRHAWKCGRATAALVCAPGLPKAVGTVSSFLPPPHRQVPLQRVLFALQR